MLKTVINVTAVAPVWTDQRVYALRLGGHVLNRHFRYYIPEFSGRIVVQTPLAVSFAYFSCVIFCGFFFFFSLFDVTVKCFHQIVMIAFIKI